MIGLLEATLIYDWLLIANLRLIYSEQPYSLIGYHIKILISDWLLQGLGLSIAGGLGSTPFKGDDEGVFISRVTPGGPADEAGLRVNDKLLSVNGVSCVNVDHYEAVGILKVVCST